MLRSTTTIAAATVAIAASLAGPAAAQQDLRNPDNRGGGGAPVTQDLRNPDRQAPVSGRQGSDLRSPDAVDAGRRVGLYSPDSVSAAATPAPSGGGFDWGDAGIGAAGMLGLLSLCAGSALIAAHMRRRRRFAAPSH